jgi:hypothetical protein
VSLLKLSSTRSTEAMSRAEEAMSQAEALGEKLDTIQSLEQVRGVVTIALHVMRLIHHCRYGLRRDRLLSKPRSGAEVHRPGLGFERGAAVSSSTQQRTHGMHPVLYTVLLSSSWWPWGVARRW